MTKARNQPTRPGDITREMVTLALAKSERDRFRRDIANKRPSKIMALHMDPARATIKIADDNEQDVSRVRKAKTRIVEQRLPVKRPPPKRETETEKLDRDGDIKRERVICPFTLPTEIANRIVSEAYSKLYGIQPEPPVKPTRLDNVLEETERYALSVYIGDRSKELEGFQISNYGESSGGTPGWARPAMQPSKQTALERLAFVHQRLNIEDRRDLNEFARMCLPLDDRKPKTPVEFGITLIKYTEKTCAEGAFLGAMRKIAQRLDVLLRLWRTSSEFYTMRQLAAA